VEYEIGASVQCIDGSAGRIVALIANPVKLELAHLAVEADHPAGARLVPVGLVRAATDAGIELGCSLTELSRLPEFHDVEFIPNVFGYGDPAATLAMPAYGLREGSVPSIIDRIPPGEVEIRRNDYLQATDGVIGRVEGLVVDGEGHITHVLLREGHVWNRKEVAIPIDSIEKIDADGIHVRLSKHELANLPDLGIHPKEPPAST
jgi:hypothetical protein